MAWRSAFVVTLLAALLLGAIQVFFPNLNCWGRPELPRQCESLVAAARHTAWKARAMRLYEAQVRERTLREYQNTWSNLGFLLAGVWIIMSARDALQRPAGISSIFLFGASSLYHASLMLELRMLDMMGVYAILLALALLTLSRRRGGIALLRTPRFVWAAFAGAVLAAVLRENTLFGVKPLDAFVIIPVVGFLLSASVVWEAYKFFRIKQWLTGWLAISGVVILLSGLAVGAFDRVGACLCAPGSWIQGHSVWHLAAAAGVGLMLKLDFRVHSQNQ